MDYRCVGSRSRTGRAAFASAPRCASSRQRLSRCWLVQQQDERGALGGACRRLFARRRARTRAGALRPSGVADVRRRHGSVVRRSRSRSATYQACSACSSRSRLLAAAARAAPCRSAICPSAASDCAARRTRDAPPTSAATSSTLSSRRGALGEVLAEGVVEPVERDVRRASRAVALQRRGVRRSSSRAVGHDVVGAARERGSEFASQEQRAGAARPEQQPDAEADREPDGHVLDPHEADAPADRLDDVEEHEQHDREPRLAGGERDRARRVGGEQHRDRQHRPQHRLVRADRDHEQRAGDDPDGGPGERAEDRPSRCRARSSAAPRASPARPRSRAAGPVRCAMYTATASPTAPRTLFRNQTEPQARVLERDRRCSSRRRRCAAAGRGRRRRRARARPRRRAAARTPPTWRAEYVAARMRNGGSSTARSAASVASTGSSGSRRTTPGPRRPRAASSRCEVGLRRRRPRAVSALAPQHGRGGRHRLRVLRAAGSSRQPDVGARNDSSQSSSSGSAASAAVAPDRPGRTMLRAEQAPAEAVDGARASGGALDRRRPALGRRSARRRAAHRGGRLALQVGAAPRRPQQHRRARFRRRQRAPSPRAGRGWPSSAPGSSPAGRTSAGSRRSTPAAK